MVKIFLFFVLVLLAGCEKETIVVESVRPVRAIQVNLSGAEGQQISFPGTVRAAQRADLSFRVDGVVILRDITVGHIAQKNELLIQLDPREYEIALKKAKGKRDSIQAQLDFARRDSERMQNIYKKDPGAISESMLDRKKEQINQFQGELEVADGEVQKADDDLAYTQLKAPFDGVVAAIYVENHEQLRAKQPALRFLDIAEREMEIQVPEKYINAFIDKKLELEFQVKLDAFAGKVFSASIKEIGTEASASTLTYPVTLSVHNIPLDYTLLPGMSGQAFLKLPKATVEKVILIPKSAIFTDNLHADAVWVINTKTERVHRKAIRVKSSSSDCVEVLEGLNDRDWIVIAGTSFLSEGQKVIIEKENARCGS